MKNSLRKYEIICKRKEIEQVLKKGTRVQTENVILRFLPAAKKRVAFLVPSKIKQAVMRNLIKRRLREIYRLNKAAFADGFEYVIQTRENAVHKNFWELKNELLNLIKGIKIDA